MSLEKKAEELTQTNMQLQVRATVCAPEDTEALFMLGATPAQPAQHGAAGTISRLTEVSVLQLGE